MDFAITIPHLGLLVLLVVLVATDIFLVFVVTVNYIAGGAALTI